MDDAVFRELVLDIYQAVSDQNHWPEVLDRLCAQVSARGCMIFEWQNRVDQRVLTAPYITSSYQREAVQSYIDKFSHWESEDQDIFERQSLSTDGIELINEGALFQNQKQYLEKPHVQEMLQYGIRHRFGGLLDKDNTRRARFAIQTSTSRGPLTAGDHLILGKLLPHVSKALELSRTVTAQIPERQAFLDAIDRLSIGICLLDEQGHVVETNTEFDRQTREFKAFWTDRSGKLVLDERADRSQFERLLADALYHGWFGARPRKEAVLMPSDGRAAALCIEVIPPKPYPEMGSSGEKYALMLSRDTTQPIEIDIDMARLTYSYTQTESEVTEMVCKGLTNSEIAQQRGRSVETINAQVKTILSKSGVSNRTQLVRLLCNFSTPQRFPGP